LPRGRSAPGLRSGGSRPDPASAHARHAMAGNSCSGGESHTADPPSTSTSLLERVKVRDPAAWRQLAELYGPVVYDWCRRLGLQAADSADTVQEVFGAVMTAIGSFRRERPGDSFRGWLWTITRNKVRDRGRRLGKEPQPQGGTAAQQQMEQIPGPPPPIEPDCPPPAGQRPEVRKAIELVRAGIEERTWQAFWRTAVDGRPAADVARELGLSRQAVYDAKYRVRRQIRQQVEDLLE